MKEKVLQECVKHLEEKIDYGKSELAELKKSVFDEGKSSVGDKHETSRAMGQIEVEKTAKQVDQLVKLLAVVNKIQISDHNVAALGSLIETDKFMYFISVPVGLVEVDGKQVFCLSNAAPIAKELLGKRAGDTIVFNGVKQSIKNIA